VTLRFFLYGQNLHTSQHGQARAIQIVRVHARDLTMAAAGQAYGLAPVCDWYYATKNRKLCKYYAPQLQRCLFLETVSKLISFPDHFLPNCFRLLVLHTVYSSGLAVFVL